MTQLERVQSAIKLAQDNAKTLGLNIPYDKGDILVLALMLMIAETTNDTN